MLRWTAPPGALSLMPSRYPTCPRILPANISRSARAFITTPTKTIWSRLQVSTCGRSSPALNHLYQGTLCKWHIDERCTCAQREARSNAVLYEQRRDCPDHVQDKKAGSENTEFVSEQMVVHGGGGNKIEPHSHAHQRRSHVDCECRSTRAAPCHEGGLVGVLPAEQRGEIKN